MNHPLPETSTNDSRRVRPITIGVAAGLLAGGAIGLVSTMPSLTSAATEDSTDDAAVVVEQEDGVDDSEPVVDDSEPVDDSRPEPGVRLRAALQPLVDDGTIDADQADAVAEHLVENRPERTGRHGRRGLDGHGPNDSVVADLLGIDRETLRAELQAGRSIADVAEANGVEIQTIIDALVADAESHIELAVEHGLDEEAAAERLARITARIEERVNRTRSTDG